MNEFYPKMKWGAEQLASFTTTKCGTMWPDQLFCIYLTQINATEFFFKYKYLKCCFYIVNNFYSPLVLYSVQAVCTFLLCLQWVVFMSAKTSCRLTRSKSKDRLGGCDHNRLLSRYIWDWVLGYGLAGTRTELSHGSSDQRVLPGARALWITSQDLSTWNEEDKQKSCSRHSKMLLGMGQQYFILLESPAIFHFPNLIL